MNKDVNAGLEECELSINLTKAVKEKAHFYRTAMALDKLSQGALDILNSVGFDWTLTGPDIKKIIADNKLSTAKKYEAFRKLHPALPSHEFVMTQVTAHGWNWVVFSDPNSGEAISKAEFKRRLAKVRTLPGYDKLDVNEPKKVVKMDTCISRTKPRVFFRHAGAPALKGCDLAGRVVFTKRGVNGYKLSFESDLPIPADLRADLMRNCEAAMLNGDIAIDATEVR